MMSRQTPPYRAENCKNQLHIGRNGRYYASHPDEYGIYRWVTTDRDTQTTRKKKDVKIYVMIDNAGHPFVADVHPSHIEIYKQRYTYTPQDGSVYYKDKKLVDTSYTRIFIGDNDLEIDDGGYTSAKGKFPGNSILIQTGPGHYIYSGDEIYSFETRDGEEIKKYYSPVGPSAVPYPYAVGENYTYFMLDRQTVPNELLDLTADGYSQFYGHSIKDKELEKRIESSKKRFKTKQIHRRVY